MKLENLKYTDSGNFFLLAGPCVIEGEYMAMDIAEKIVGITESLQIPYIFKGSYRKANRSRLDSFTGIGDEKALKILRKVADTYKIPVVTDIHTAEEAKMAAEYVDVLQIPAFCAARPICWWLLQNRASGEYQERPIPVARGHEVCRSKGRGCGE